MLKDPDKCLPLNMNNGKLDFFKVGGIEYFCQPSSKTEEQFLGVPKDQAAAGTSVFAYAIHGKIIFYNIFIQMPYNIHEDQSIHWKYVCTFLNSKTEFVKNNCSH